MNCLFPYKATIGSVIQEFRSTYFHHNKLFDKRYMIKKVFKELIEYLQVDETLQKQEISQAIKDFSSEQEIYNWLVRELNVLIGSLYEQEVADMLINYQLTPSFTNKNDKFINLTNLAQMKMPDLVVQSFKDGSYHAFDVKSGVIWRKKLQTVDENLVLSPIYVYNTNLTIQKINELYFAFRRQMEKDLKAPVHMYILFVCYDLLTKVNFCNQADYYQLAFSDAPDHAEKVCFVIDLKDLFVEDEDFADDETFNKHSPYVLRLEDEVDEEIKRLFTSKYAIQVNSPISLTLKDFIHSRLL